MVIKLQGFDATGFIISIVLEVGETRSSALTALVPLLLRLAFVMMPV